MASILIILGAPGAGKGTQTKFLMNARGLTCRPIVISELLVTPEAQKIKEQGGMVGDTEVVGILLRKLLEQDFRDGAVLDGFPRTRGHRRAPSLATGSKERHLPVPVHPRLVAE